MGANGGTTTGGGDVWVRRWETLDNLMQDINAGLTGRLLTRQTTLQSLVQCLRDFANHHFHYFYDGFHATPQSLAPSSDFPEAYVYSVILNQIGHDLEVISRAIQQRDTGSAAMSDTLLRKADKLAALALQPAMDQGLLPSETVALTYFEKSPAVRVVPYTHIALIAVPFTSMAINRDLLAIPHEAGHFVFWHGGCRDMNSAKPIYQLALEKLRDKQIVAEDSPLFRVWYHWLEETFADVYGCLIAGPVLAQDFQDLQLHTSRQEFLEGDSIHPVPAMRPFIYQQVLNSRAASNKAFDAWARILGLAWISELNNKHGGETVKLPEEMGVQAAPDSEIKINVLTAAFTLPRRMAVLVDIALGILANIPASDWTGGALTGDLYQNFQANIAALPNLTRDLFDRLDWNKWLLDLKADSAGWYTANSVGPKKEQDPDWLPVLMAGGWTTDGPTDRWP